MPYDRGEYCEENNDNHDGTDKKIPVIISAIMNHNPKAAKRDKTQYKVERRSEDFVSFLGFANAFKES